MDLYFRGYDLASPATSGAQHLSAAAARIALSIVRSVTLLPDAAFAELKRLLSVQALWGLSVVLAGWLIATVLGGPVAWAVNLLLIGYGLVELWDVLKATGAEVRDWLGAAYYASGEAELEVAAQHFANALSKGLLTVLEVLIAHRVFRSVEGEIHKRFPTPSWLTAQYERALRKREDARKPSTPARPVETPQTPAQKGRSIAKELVETAASGVRAEGSKRVASAVPTVALVLGSATLLVGTIAVAAWVTSAAPRRREP